MFRFTIRDVLWLMVVAALGLSWWVDNARIEKAVTRLETERRDLQADFEDRITILNRPRKPSAKIAQGELRQLNGIGKPLELSFVDVMTGKRISMTDLRGKVVVIQFWATTSGACLAEMPSLKSTFAKYRDEGVEFIGVNLDYPSVGWYTVKNCIVDQQMTWPQYYQGNGWESEFSQSWGISGLPTLFVVNQDGNLHSTQAHGRLDFIIDELLDSRARTN